MFFVLDPWSYAPVAYSQIRPKSQIKHITAVSTRNATSSKFTTYKFYRRPRTGALRLVFNIGRLCSMDQKFHGDEDKTLEPRF
jgi:hypothetical protein